VGGYGGDGMPNSLCRLKAVMGSSGRECVSWLWRGIIGFEGNLVQEILYLIVYQSSVGVQ